MQKQTIIRPTCRRSQSLGDTNQLIQEIKNRRDKDRDIVIQNSRRKFSNLGRSFNSSVACHGSSRSSRSLSPQRESKGISNKIIGKTISPGKWIKKLKPNMTRHSSIEKEIAKTPVLQDKRQNKNKEKKNSFGKTVLEEERSIDRSYDLRILPSEESDDMNYCHGLKGNEDENSLSSIGTQSTNEYDPESSRMTALVWKRKSGFTNLLKTGYVKASERANTLGMKSVSNFQKLMKVNSVNSQNSDLTSSTGSGPPSNIKIWERRRIVLEGGILMYFHEDADMDVIDENDENSEKGNKQLPQIHAPIPFTKNKSFTKFKNKLMEFSHATFSQTAENDQSKTAYTNSAINTPRGLIDLVATHATASATNLTPNSHAPTPYSLSIIIKSEVKWLLCFASSEELLSWLGALTDISIKQSLDSYQIDHGYSFHANYDNDEENINNNTEDINVEMSIDVDNARGPGEINISGNDISERTPLLQSKQKPLTSSQSITTHDGQDIYALMAIANCLIMIFSMMLLDVTKIVLFLGIQTAMNGAMWCYLSYRRQINLVEDKINEPSTTGNEDEFELSNSINALQSSVMVTPNQKVTMRGRSFSTDDRDLREQPSFVEISKQETIDEFVYKPKAGDSLVQLNHSMEAVSMKGGCVGWVAAPTSSIHVRGASYLIDKQKVPSPTSLYELIHVDAFDSNVHMLDVGIKFELPEVEFGTQGHWRAPNLLVISFALPTTAPKLGKSSDGKGYIVIGYYRMRDETRKVLEIITNNELNAIDQERKLKELFPHPHDRQRINGIKLWEKWCLCAPTDQEMQKRLKFIPRGDNLKEIGVPSWICKYNGKPMLIKRPGVTSFVYSHQDENMMEIDINMHPLPYMFRQAMTYLKEHYFPQMIMTFAFIIEGREEDELPEVLLGNPLQLPFVHPKYVAKSETVFNKQFLI